MRARTSIYTLTALTLAALVLPACAFQSLHSPRPEPPGQVSVGVHGGVAMFAGETSKGVLAAATFRVGVVDHIELGATAGTLGADVAFKYGFMDYESALQVSVLAGLGLYGWEIFDPTIGVLVGYNIAQVVMPYAGYRQHFLVWEGLGMVSNVIAGLEIFAGDLISFMFEWDYSFTFESLEIFDHDLQGISTLNFGISFHF